MSRFVYCGSLDVLFSLSIVNWLLRVVTFGIYGFWGRTKIRKYLASSFSVFGQSFKYIGKGGQLFKGYLKVLALVVPLLLLAGACNSLDKSPSTHGLVLILYIFISILWYYFYFVAKYAVLKYRMAKTLWGDVRGKLTKSVFGLGFKDALYTLFALLSLGILWPYFKVKAYKLLADNIYIGNDKLQFNGSAKSLFKIHLITLLLLVPTLGLSRLWYMAACRRYLYGNTRGKHITFEVRYKGIDLLKLYLGNGLIMLFTLGLCNFIVIHRKSKYFAKFVSVGGLDEVKNSYVPSNEMSSGEGLESYIGADI